ncbi:hypothetical protein [Bacillus sp. B15-48]|uniref:hypothetical protein n=1 Tax=Bacillus sp. B15-48 TaxID=1548601 RepID=UPI00193F5CE4|nr:hypothetical protein [Bacillus sp. B15-48]MBM4765138.1 hypothetical protein [Bacillus sp. B15-48]
MKALGICLLIFLLTMFLCLFMDIMLGFTFYQALFNLFSPFWVIETGEIIMLAFIFFLTIGQQLMFSVKNKANKQKGSS